MSKIIKPAWVLNDNETVVQIPDAPIPKPNISQLLEGVTEQEAEKILQETMQPVIEVDYEEILRKAQENAEMLSQKMIIHAKKERGSILADAEAEAIKIKEQARKEGYASGVAQKADEIDASINALSQKITEISNAHQQFVADYTIKLKHLAVEISRKIIDTAADQNPEMLIPLIRNAVDTVKDCEWVTVEVSNQIAETAAFLDKEYQKVRPGKARVEVRTINADKTTCILKTPDGVIDASPEIQLNNLKDFFEHMDMQAE